MRKKTLAAFAVVYAGICLTYSAVNGINLPETEAAAEAVEETQPATETTAIPTTIVPETTEPFTEASHKSRKHHREWTAEETTEEMTNPPTESVTETKTQNIEETTEAPDVPTLEEYLKKKRCGGCGHGCSLANPRCMQGARKQSAAISEYNTQYGG